MSELGFKKYTSVTELIQSIWDELDQLKGTEAVCVVRGAGHQSGVLISKEFYLSLYAAWNREQNPDAPPAAVKTKEELEKWVVTECLKRSLPNLEDDLQFYTKEERGKIRKLRRSVEQRAKELELDLGEIENEENLEQDSDTD